MEINNNIISELESAFTFAARRIRSRKTDAKNLSDKEIMEIIDDECGDADFSNYFGIMGYTILENNINILREYL